MMTNVSLYYVSPRSPLSICTSNSVHEWQCKRSFKTKILLSKIIKWSSPSVEKYFRQIFKDYHSWSYCEKTLFLKLQMRALKLLYCLRGTCFTRSGNWFSLWHTTTSSRDVHDKVIRLNKYFTVVWASTLEFSVKRGTAKYCNSHWYSKYFRVISQTLLIDVLVKGKNSAVMFLNGQPPRCSS